MYRARKDVLQCISYEKVLRICQDLIRIPSVSAEKFHPGFPGRFEEEKAEYLKDRMEKLGMKVVNSGDVEAGRPNYIGTLKGTGNGENLMFTAHLDTHPPPEEMRNPWCGEVKDGLIWGLGAADQYPSIAAFLGALEALVECKIRLKGDVIVAFDCDEYVHSRGVQLIINWLRKNKVRAAFAMVGEPAGFPYSIGIANPSGGVEMEVETYGGAGFAGFKEKRLAEKFGVTYRNAVVDMVKIVEMLQKMAEEENMFKKEHALLGRAKFYIGPIEGGSRYPGIFSAVAQHEPLKIGMRNYDAFHIRGYSAAFVPPEYCRLRFGIMGCLPRRRRPNEVLTTECVGGMSSRDVVNMVEKWLRKVRKAEPAIKFETRLINDRNIPYDLSPNEPHIKILVKTINEVIGKKPKLIGTRHPCPNVSRMAEQLRIPFAQIAPTLYRYHAATESCPLEDMNKSVELYALAIQNFCDVA